MRFIPAGAIVALIILQVPAIVCGGELTDGVWGAAAGSDTYYWEFWPEGSGLGAIVHTVRDGKKQTELPVDGVIWNPPELELQMRTTGVTYRGHVDLETGVIDGQLFYDGQEGARMELRQEAVRGIAGLRPRPDDAAPYRYARPAETGDGWTTADCADHDLSVADVESVVAAICAGEAGVIHSLLLIADGDLIVEEYFHGYGRDDLHRLASVTKSVSSLLVGAAIDAGAIPGVDTPLLDFFPDRAAPADPRWRRVTLGHLLSMTMGLDWGDADPHGTGPAFFKTVLERPIGHEPGTTWAYQSANVDLIAGVLKQATGQHADQFAEQHLFAPLGITDYDWVVHGQRRLPAHGRQPGLAAARHGQAGPAPARFRSLARPAGSLGGLDPTVDRPPRGHRRLRALRLSVVAG